MVSCGLSGAIFTPGDGESYCGSALTPSSSGGLRYQWKQLQQFRFIEVGIDPNISSVADADALLFERAAAALWRQLVLCCRISWVAINFHI